MRCIYLLCLCSTIAWAQQPVQVRIHIAAGAPVSTMRGGIGASFHVMATELPGRKANGDSWSGSGWGGNPNPGDDRHWQELFKHAEWLGLDWCRVELEQRVYEPRRGVFDWDNPEMQVLYRILDWADRRGVDVFFSRCGATLPGTLIPAMRRTPSSGCAARLIRFRIGLKESATWSSTWCE